MQVLQLSADATAASITVNVTHLDQLQGEIRDSAEQNAVHAYSAALNLELGGSDVTWKDGRLTGGAFFEKIKEQFANAIDGIELEDIKDWMVVVDEHSGEVIGVALIVEGENGLDSTLLVNDENGSLSQELYAQIGGVTTAELGSDFIVPQIESKINFYGERASRFNLNILESNYRLAVARDYYLEKKDTVGLTDQEQSELTAINRHYLLKDATAADLRAKWEAAAFAHEETYGLISAEAYSGQTKAETAEGYIQVRDSWNANRPESVAGLSAHYRRYGYHSRINSNGTEAWNAQISKINTALEGYIAGDITTAELVSSHGFRDLFFGDLIEGGKLSEDGYVSITIDFDKQIELGNSIIQFVESASTVDVGLALLWRGGRGLAHHNIGSILKFDTNGDQQYTDEDLYSDKENRIPVEGVVTLNIFTQADYFTTTSTLVELDAALQRVSQLSQNHDWAWNPELLGQDVEVKDLILLSLAADEYLGPAVDDTFVVGNQEELYDDLYGLYELYGV